MARGRTSWIRFKPLLGGMQTIMLHAAKRGLLLKLRRQASNHRKPSSSWSGFEEIHDRSPPRRELSARSAPRACSP